MFNNFSFWSLILNIIILIVSGVSFVKLINNDLKHLSLKVDELMDSNKENCKFIKKLDERLSRLEGFIKGKLQS